MNPVCCLTCHASLSSQDIREGWCENCGKKIPRYVLKEAVAQTAYAEESIDAASAAPGNQDRVAGTGYCHAPSSARTWTGDMGGDLRGRPSHSLVHLGSDHLYIKGHFLTKSGRDEAATNLANGKSPEELLGWGTAKIPLADISELRLSDALNLLEIYCGEERRCYEIQGERDPFHVWVYSALRDRLAPGAVPEAGFASRKAAILGPIGGLLLTLFVAACFLYVAADANPDPHFRAGTKNLIEVFLYKIGFVGVALIALPVILFFICWIIYRWRNPPVAEVIRISRPGGD